MTVQSDPRGEPPPAPEGGALAQFVLAVLVTQMDGFRRILGTTEINARQFGWALLAALALLLGWEPGTFLARRSRGGG
ncbi:hypothetical protein [Streptomyces coffeae]|uniref:hypothetical protein n=1 Tax=Streptomyces coffeae TaxID=621382 RepID=UPI001F1C8755|nr:hypothetical protein [Streptomyces coffeae]